MSAADHVLALTSAGDPRSPRTWSGTPRNIITELERLGITVVGIDWARRRWLRAGNLLLHYATGMGFDYLRGPFSRSYSGRLVQRDLRRCGCRKVLHMGTLALPLPWPDPGVEQYWYSDTTWDLWYRGATNQRRYSARQYRRIEDLERRAYGQITHFFAVSRYVRENLIGHYGIDPGRTTVVGTGRGGLKPYDGPKDYRSGHILLAAKKRFEDKGGPLLIESFRLAIQKRPELKLVIVADESYRPLIEGIRNAEITGFIPWERLQELFNNAALYAMPAHNEPWGLVYLEALLCRAPVLGLRRYSLPEITVGGRHGFLVDSANPTAIADAIVEAFSDPDRLDEMGRLGQRFVLDTYSWPRVAAAIASRIFGNEPAAVSTKLPAQETTV